MTVYTTSIPSISAIREQVAELVCSGQPLAAKTLIEEMLCLVEQALTPALDANTAAAIVAAAHRIQQYSLHIRAPLSARYQHHKDTPCIS